MPSYDLPTLLKKAGQWSSLEKRPTELVAMKIYFACSIKGGRALAETYQLVLSVLTELGHIVLNSHVADEDPSLAEGSSEEVFERDKTWIVASDLLIAEVSTPSIGVGYEIAFALSLGKHVVCLYREDFDIARLSFMIAGNTEPKLSLRRYSPANLQDVLGPSLQQLR